MSVDWFGDAVLEKARKAALGAVTRGGFAVHEEATSQILDGEKTGRIYRRRGVEHQASAPGEAPASDIGRLVQSGKVELKPAELAADINWSTDYAEGLEYGTENVAARSFARPALANKADEIQQDIGDSISDALK